VITQTLALFLDAYRELNAKRLFWIVLMLSALVVLVLAGVGLSDEHVTLFRMRLPFEWFAPKAELYKALFTAVGVNFWLTIAASILALVSTASIFPDFISGGSIDLYLCKPISRLRLFCTKYVAGLLFVALQVLVFSTLAFAVLGVRGGTWEWGIFLAVPIVVCFFSYVYCICVLVGVVTRSTLAAILLTILAWFCIWVVDFGEVNLLTLKHGGERQQARSDVQLKILQGQLQYLEKRPPEKQAQEQEMIDHLRRQRQELLDKREAGGQSTVVRLHRWTYAVKTLLPKTRETTELLSRKLLEAPDASGIDEEARAGPFAVVDVVKAAETMHARPLWWVVGTSLTFEAVVVAIAAWKFCRRDY
jgi:hypothetical protein